MSCGDKNYSTVAFKQKIVIKQAFYFVIESIIKDIIEIATTKCIEEDEYDFTELRKYVENLSDGVKCRLLKTSGKTYFNNRFYEEMMDEITPLKHKLKLSNSFNVTMKSHTVTDADMKTKVVETPTYFGVVGKLTEHFTELCRWHIWNTLNINHVSITDVHKQFPSLDCKCSVEVVGEIKKKDGGRALNYDDEETEKKIIDDFITCINKCKCVARLPKFLDEKKKGGF